VAVKILKIYIKVLSTLSVECSYFVVLSSVYFLLQGRIVLLSSMRMQTEASF
jgi:hypothetical protein